MSNMGSLQEAITLRQQLVAEWKTGRNPNLDKCSELLNRLKIVLTHLTFLPGTTGSGKSSKEEIIIARDVLEIGAFWKPSSKWLQVVPSHQLGLYLDNSTARIAIGLRLGTKVCEPHICICNELVKENGLHGLSCNKSKGTYIRHTDINKIFSMAFSSAQFPNTLEPYGLSRLDGQRPDGITIVPWSRGKALIWDVTVVDTVAPSHLRLTSKNCGSAADEAERGKHNDYINLKAEYNFIPLAFESFGSIGPETSKFLNILGKLMSRATGEPRSLDFLLQRISIAIQRGNAINVLGTFKEQTCDNVFL